MSIWKASNFENYKIILIKKYQKDPKVEKYGLVYPWIIFLFLFRSSLHWAVHSSRILSRSFWITRCSLARPRMIISISLELIPKNSRSRPKKIVRYSFFIRIQTILRTLESCHEKQYDAEELLHMLLHYHVSVMQGSHFLKDWKKRPKKLGKPMQSMMGMEPNCKNNLHGIWNMVNESWC